MSSKVRNGMRKARKILKGFYAENSLEVGIDEAGRGPLFGRVYVGAAILHPTDFDHSLMRDSKKLSYRKSSDKYFVTARPQGGSNFIDFGGFTKDMEGGVLIIREPNEPCSYVS